MATINYGAGPRITDVGDCIVYTKAAWSDAWTVMPNLVCTECTWKAAPEFSSAMLVWRTGYIIMPGDTSPTLFGPWVAVVNSFASIGCVTMHRFCDGSDSSTAVPGRPKHSVINQS